MWETNPIGNGRISVSTPSPQQPYCEQMRGTLAFKPSPSIARTSLLSACFLTALGFAILATACGAEPQQMPLSFEARPTPTPDAPPPPTPTVLGGPHSTPTAMPASTPTPASTPKPEPPTVPPADWNLDASTTGSDLLALLSEHERSCMQRALGDRLSAFQNGAFIANVDATTGQAMEDCLTPESNTGIAIAIFSASAGGLSGETRYCLADVFAANPRGALVGAIGGPAPSDEAGSTTFDALSCLTPEEAAAMTPEDQEPPPDVVGLRCLSEELLKVEGGAEVLRIFSTADPAGLTLEQSALLGQVVSTCGIETDFIFPEPGDASSASGSASTDQGADTPSQ